MKLLVSRQATLRLREIARYIHDQNPDAALGVSRSIQDAFVLLAAYPKAGRLTQGDVRRFPVPRPALSHLLQGR